MNAPTRQQVLQLYRHLIKYGNQLQFTDKKYFKDRVREEFRNNKGLESAEEIDFSFKVKFTNLKLVHTNSISPSLFQRGEALLNNGRIV